MKIIIFINAFNIILDYFFVYVLSMNIEGVAYASVIAESSVIIFVAYFLLQITTLLINQYLLNLSLKLKSKNKLIVNGNMFIRSVILMTCFAVFMSQSASQRNHSSEYYFT